MRHSVVASKESAVVSCMLTVFIVIIPRLPSVIFFRREDNLCVLSFILFAKKITSLLILVHANVTAYHKDMSDESWNMVTVAASAAYVHISLIPRRLGRNQKLTSAGFNGIVDGQEDHQ